MSHWPDDDDETQDELEEADESDLPADDDTDPCPHCGRPVYVEAQRCPHCGDYITMEQQADRSGYPIWVIVGAVLALVAILTFILL